GAGGGGVRGGGEGAPQRRFGGSVEPVRHVEVDQRQVDGLLVRYELLGRGKIGAELLRRGGAGDGETGAVRVLLTKRRRNVHLPLVTPRLQRRAIRRIGKLMRPGLRLPDKPSPLVQLQLRTAVGP